MRRPARVPRTSLHRGLARALDLLAIDSLPAATRVNEAACGELQEIRNLQILCRKIVVSKVRRTA